MRVLGLDYGSVRIGVAVSDEGGSLAFPHGVVGAVPERKCVGEVARICCEKGVGTIVVGLPKHMCGDEGESAVAARRLGALVADATGIPVKFVDERLSTVAADKALSEANVRGSKKRGRIDAAAAAVILQTYLDSEQCAQF